MPHRLLGFKIKLFRLLEDLCKILSYLRDKKNDKKRLLALYNFSHWALLLHWTNLIKYFEIKFIYK
jgi:hypothetical protein